MCFRFNLQHHYSFKMNLIFKSEATIKDFIERLKSELSADLPGVDAHVKLAPGMRVNDIKTGLVALLYSCWKELFQFLPVLRV